jgi:hypothetical protein
MARKQKILSDPVRYPTWRRVDTFIASPLDSGESLADPSPGIRNAERHFRACTSPIFTSRYRCRAFGDTLGVSRLHKVCTA